MYQPTFAAQLSAALDAKGMPLAWKHRIASPAVTASFGAVAMEAETLGARDLPYAVPNIRIEYTHVATPMPMGWWRAIQFVPNIFAREAFLDELAAEAKIDPLAYRLSLLNGQSQADFAAAKLAPGQTKHEHVDVARLRAVLTLVAEKAGWNTAVPKGHGRGIACLSYDDRSYVAQVAEVSVSKSGQLRVLKVTTALDVGLVINPLGVVAQVESGIVWALTAALYGDMRFADGRASRTSFAQYRVAKLTDMPLIETHLVRSSHAPSGAGEPPVPAVAPAIVNAIFAATGKRVRSLPITPASLA
jgi:isoquinoline 1-oxidoreductase beta subunit